MAIFSPEPQVITAAAKHFMTVALALAGRSEMALVNTFRIDVQPHGSTRAPWNTSARYQPLHWTCGCSDCTGDFSFRDKCSIVSFLWQYPSARIICCQGRFVSSGPFMHMNKHLDYCKLVHIGWEVAPLALPWRCYCTSHPTKD